MGMAAGSNSTALRAYFQSIFSVPFSIVMQFSWALSHFRYHMVAEARPGFFNSLPARCSGSPVGVLLFCFSPLRVHFPAILQLILYGQLPQWPRVGAEGFFSASLKRFLMAIRSL